LKKRLETKKEEIYEEFLEEGEKVKEEKVITNTTLEITKKDNQQIKRRLKEDY